MTTSQDLVTIDQLARQLPVSKRWLQREAQAGRIPSLLAGRRRLFNLEAVRASIAQQAAESKGGQA
ncbi:MAG: helix-turn-helix domain-containing protein [Planctomycetota bacterium]